MRKQLLLLILLALLPIVGSAYDVKIDGIYYNLDTTEKTATVTYQFSNSNDNKNAYKGNVTIPDDISYNDVSYKVTTIDNQAFGGCSSLTSVTIGNNVTTIKQVAFWECTKLKTIVIPNSVSSIGHTAFYHCRSLSSISIPNSVTAIKNMTFQGCTSLTSVTIPNNITTIGNQAFYGCSKITSISIGRSIKSIGEKAFAKCESLTDVTCYSSVVPETSQDAFDESNTENATLIVPESAIDIYKSTIPWSYFKQIVTIPGITFTLLYLVDGEVYKTLRIEEGNEIVPEAEPTKEGYTFSGWSEIPETMPNHDVTVTGSFTVNKYQLVYKVDDEEYKSYEIEYGAPITPEAEPTKEGYSFSGWSEIPETMPNHDVTVTGTFTINKYKLVYMVDNEEYKSYELEYGATITPEKEPTKEGYTFSGWNDIPETMPAKDVTVTGTFSVNKYKLVYKVDGEEYKSYEVEYGATITPEEEPTKEGYTFSGWSWIPSKMPAEDVMITGSFKINQYTITYMIDGEEYQTEKVDYNSKITPPTPPEKAGFDFAWGEYPETMPAHDITISGTYTTGIMSIEIESDKAKIFTLDGKQIYQAQKGVNIVRMNNGSIKKVVVK